MRLSPRLLISLVLLGACGGARAESYLTSYDQTPTQYQANYDDLVPQGYRPLAITAHEGVSGPVFQVVWVNDGFTNWTSAIEMTWSDYQTFSTAQTSQGFRPLCVENYGTFPNELYASIWVMDGVLSPWQARYQMSLSDFQTQLNQLGSAGYRPYWISGCGTGANKKFSALWVNNGIPELTILDSTRAGFDDQVQNFRTGGYRLVSATGYNGASVPLLSGVTTKKEHPPWESFHDQTLAELNATTTQYTSLGYRPTFVTAFETTSGSRYTSAWEEIPKPKVWTVTGPASPELAHFDTTLHQFMQAQHVPNAGVAVTKNGRLVLARGYTYAPIDWPIAQPDTRFRVASLSKTLTAVGVMKLIQAGVIGFDQPISTIIDTSGWVDSRINQVTVRHLLQHWGGWNSSVSGEPMYSDFAVSAVTGQPLPTTPQMIVDYMATRPLDYDPGTQNIYSIFGYCLMGRVLETATGADYETWMHDNIFSPIQVYGPRVGNSLLSQQYAGEPPYVDPYQRINRCVMGPGAPEWTPMTYGAFNVHTHYSSAGCISSAVDYVRFLTAFDDPDNSPLLSRPTIDLMWSRPPGIPPTATSYYGAGWNIQSCGAPGQICASHSGAMPGTLTFYSHRADGVNWVVLFSIEGLPGFAGINQTMESLVNNTTQWPTYDHFSMFGRGDLDCDGEVTMQDIPEFALGLIDPDAYALAHPTCAPTRADMNGDEAVNGGDIPLFVEKLLSGQ